MISVLEGGYNTNTGIISSFAQSVFYYVRYMNIGINMLQCYNVNLTKEKRKIIYEEEMELYNSISKPIIKARRSDRLKHIEEYKEKRNEEIKKNENEKNDEEKIIKEDINKNNIVNNNEKKNQDNKITFDNIKNDNNNINNNANDKNIEENIIPNNDIKPNEQLDN